MAVFLYHKISTLTTLIRSLDMSFPKNPLTELNTYSYYHVVAICDSTTAAFDLANNNSASMWQHPEGTTGRETYYDVNSHPDDPRYAIRETDGGGRYILLINNSTDATYVVESAAFNFVMMETPEMGSDGIGTTGVITVSEPRGVSFQDRVVMSCMQMGISQSASYIVVKTFVVGFGRDGRELMSFNDIPPFVGTVTNFQSEFNEAGSTHTIELTSAMNGAGNRAEVAQVSRSINFSASGTLAEVLDRFIEIVNGVAQVVSACTIDYAAINSPVVADQLIHPSYRIITDPIYNTQDYTVTDDVSQFKNQPGTDVPIQISIPANTSIAEAIKLIMSRCPKVKADATKGDQGKVYDFVINSGIESNSSGKMEMVYRVSRRVDPIAVSGAKTTEVVNILSQQGHNIPRASVINRDVSGDVPAINTPNITPQNNRTSFMGAVLSKYGYDENFKKISQAIIPSLNTSVEERNVEHLTPASKQSEVSHYIGPSIEEVAENTMIFDYQFSGRNIDVLEFHMNANAGAYIYSANIANSFKGQGDKSARNLRIPSAMDLHQQGTIRQTPVATPISLGSHAQTVGERIDATTDYQSRMNIGKFIALSQPTVSVTVAGNLHILNQCFGNDLSVSNGNTSGAFSTMNPTFIKIRVYTPITNKDFSPTAFGYSESFWFDGLYRVVQTNTVFENGTIVHNLSLIALSTNDSIDLAAMNSVPKSCVDSVLGCAGLIDESASANASLTSNETGAAYTGGGPYGGGNLGSIDTSGKYPIGVGMHPNVRAFLDLISRFEGTHESKGKLGYAQMGGYRGTLNVNAPHPKAPWKFGKGTSTAHGRYQFLFKTWISVHGGRNVPMTPANQDAGAIALLKRRGIFNEVLAGDWRAALTKKGSKSQHPAVGLEWASFPGSPYGQKTHSLSEALTLLNRLQTHYSGASNETSLQTPTVPVKNADHTKTNRSMYPDSFNRLRSATQPKPQSKPSTPAHSNTAGKDAKPVKTKADNIKLGTKEFDFNSLTKGQRARTKAPATGFQNIDYAYMNKTASDMDKEIDGWASTRKDVKAAITSSNKQYAYALAVLTKQDGISKSSSTFKISESKWIELAKKGVLSSYDSSIKAKTSYSEAERSNILKRRNDPNVASKAMVWIIENEYIKGTGSHSIPAIYLSHTLGPSVASKLYQDSSKGKLARDVIPNWSVVYEQHKTLFNSNAAITVDEVLNQSSWMVYRHIRSDSLSSSLSSSKGTNVDVDNTNDALLALASTSKTARDVLESLQRCHAKFQAERDLNASRASEEQTTGTKQ